MDEDRSTTVEQLKLLIQKFCEAREWDKFHNAKDLAIGIVTEGSELLERFRFKSETEVDRLFNSPESKAEVAEEISDTLYFTLRLAQRYNIDVSSELRKKLKKNEVRYPVQKAKGSNKKYTEFDA